MGATGSMLESGEFSVQNWATVDYIEGIKVLEAKKGNNSRGLPALSHTKGTQYILMDKNGKFKQLRKYGMDNKPLFDIDYGRHNNETTFHMHYYRNGIKQPQDYAVPKSLIEKYKNAFKGVPAKWLK